MTTADPLAEYREGYRDGLVVSTKVAQQVAAEPGTTAEDVLVLLEALSESHVLDRPGGTS